LKDAVNQPKPTHNDFYLNGGDPQLGFFLAYTGPVNPDGTGGERIPYQWVPEGLIAGLAPYRPPVAAYVHALTKTQRVQHRIYHGERPAVRGFIHTSLLSSPEPPVGGIEIYYSSPSFLLTAGGMFTNSGYGHDELVDFKNVGAVQSTTLLPTHADVLFEDVIRFDIYPDNRNATNYGVHLGFACGANLRGLDRWCQLTGTSTAGPWILLNLDAPLPGYERLGFFVAIYKTPERYPESYVTVPENVGFLYAVEASSMPSFDKFARLTVERNTGLPAQLAIGENYVFHAPDNHTFGFRLWPMGVPYLPIVHHLDDQVIMEDARQLPLVDADLRELPGSAIGGYLKSVGSHEGHFEIRHPRCAQPLVLDYRDPLDPHRTEDESACPAWLNDLAGAYLALATEEFAAGDRTAAAGSTSSATDAYRRVAAASPDTVAYQRTLIWALQNLAARYSQLGQPARSAGLGTEALAVLARIAAVAGVSDADWADVASNLTGIGAYLPPGEEAAAVAAAAVDIYRRIAPD
jgi:hypothetical protein